MGLFNLFKKNNTEISKKQTTPQNDTTKSFDYFAFKVHGVATVDGAQEILKTLGCELHEKPSFVMLKLENNVLNVYLNNKLIGSGDTSATNKFVEHCNKKW